MYIKIKREIKILKVQDIIEIKNITLKNISFNKNYKQTPAPKYANFLYESNILKDFIKYGYLQQGHNLSLITLPILQESLCILHKFILNRKNRIK